MGTWKNPLCFVHPIRLLEKSGEEIVHVAEPADFEPSAGKRIRYACCRGLASGVGKWIDRLESGHSAPGPSESWRARRCVCPACACAYDAKRASGGGPTAIARCTSFSSLWRH